MDIGSSIQLDASECFFETFRLDSWAIDAGNSMRVQLALHYIGRGQGEPNIFENAYAPRTLIASQASILREKAGWNIRPVLGYSNLPIFAQ